MRDCRYELINFLVRSKAFAKPRPLTILFTQAVEISLTGAVEQPCLDPLWRVSDVALATLETDCKSETGTLERLVCLT